MLSLDANLQLTVHFFQNMINQNQLEYCLNANASIKTHALQQMYFKMEDFKGMFLPI